MDVNEETQNLLRHSGNLSRLAESPLAELKVVGARVAQWKLSDTPINRAMVLQEVVSNIVRAKLSDIAGARTTRAWTALRLQYLEYMTVAEAASQMSVSRRTFQRDVALGETLLAQEILQQLIVPERGLSVPDLNIQSA